MQARFAPGQMHYMILYYVDPEILCNIDNHSFQGHRCLARTHQNLNQGKAYIRGVHKLQGIRYATVDGC